MKVTRAGRQPCDPRYSRVAERIEALQAELTALASELSVVSGNAGQAVVTAEGAQASAEASAAEAGTARTAAEAVAEVAQGVSDRVTAAEGAIDDVQAYAEAIGDDVSAIDTEIHTTRPYVDTNTEQTITAKKHIPTATAGDNSDVWVNKAFVQASGVNKPNNLIHNVGDEEKTGYLKQKYDMIRYVSTNTPGDTDPATYQGGNAYRVISQADEGNIISAGFEKSPIGTVRHILTMQTSRINGVKWKAEIHFIFNVIDKKISMVPVVTTDTKPRTFGAETVLMQWSD